MNTLENMNTWPGLFYVSAWLFALYWALKALHFTLRRSSGRTAIVKWGSVAVKQILILYKPIAVLIVVLDFLAINILVHGLFIVLVGALANAPIRTYVSGLLIRLNPLLRVGSVITINDFSGEVKRLMPMGMVVRTELGERFYSYSGIDRSGFTVNANDTGQHRNTLILNTQHKKSDILDLLFDNPLLNFGEPPSLRDGDYNEELKLQYTLEAGADNEDLIAFFAENEINIKLTSNSDQQWKY